MQQLNVRPASVDDHAAWLRMRQALWPHVDEADHAQEVSVLLDQDEDEGAVFLASDGEGIVGFLEVSRAPEAPHCSTEPVALLEAWYVEPPSRRSGIGRALVQEAEAWATSWQLREMASDAHADNHASRAAHRAVGFEEADEDVHFRKDVAIF